jgi:hypothetical protein
LKDVLLRRPAIKINPHIRVLHLRIEFQDVTRRHGTLNMISESLCEADDLFILGIARLVLSGDIKYVGGVFEIYHKD